jgi:hypothetical protein
MLLLEPLPAYQTLRYKIAWVNTRGKDLSEISAFLEQNAYPRLNMGVFIAEHLSENNAAELPSLDVSYILTEKIKKESRILEGWAQPLICLNNLGILLEPELGLHPSNILKDISKNIFLIILWEYFYDEPGIFHWDNQKQTYRLDFSDIGIKKIPFKDEI